MKNTTENTLGARIKAQRIRCGMTQEELAEKMCTTKSMISYYENNHGDMKQSMIEEFAAVLGTTKEYLFCGLMALPDTDENTVEMLNLFTKMDATRQEWMLIQMRALALQN